MVAIQFLGSSEALNPSLLPGFEEWGLGVKTETLRKEGPADFYPSINSSFRFGPVSVPTGRTESVVMSLVGMKLLGDGTISTAPSAIPEFSFSLDP